nr:RsmB/NOP family class I SAM-dependent RNA methyltransferase [Candidatus Sigynarchaeum springense]
MVLTSFPRDPKLLWLVARACKEIMVDGLQQDLVLARFREERRVKGGIRRLVGDIITIIQHHGLLNFITINASHDLGGMPGKDEERHFLYITIIFYVFKDRIEKGVFPRFTDAEKDIALESIESLKSQIKGNVSAFVHNAVRLDIPRLLRDKDPVERLSILFSHPSAFVERLRRMLPADRVERILRVQQDPGTFFIVARNEKISSRLVKFMVHEGIAFQNDKTFANVFQVSSLVGAKRRIVESAILDMKDVMIQDWASIAVLEALNAEKNDVIIDACAAPFQKTTGIWWRCGGSGTLLAMEASPVRALANARRLPIEARKAIHVVVSDAARLGAFLRRVEPNKILLDVPCTGSGSLAAFPELKARQSANDIAFFSSLQRKILDDVLNACETNGWKGVHIVYSSCSYYPEEGEEIIDHFFEKIDLVDLHDPNASTARLAALSTGWKGYTCSPRVARTFPDTNGRSKAFFIAAFTTRA